MSRSDYDDMPSNGGERRGKGNKGLTLGVLICILVILIIIVVRLIFKPEEKLEVLPPNTVVKESSVNNEVSEETQTQTPTLDDSVLELTEESVEISEEDPLISEVDETLNLEIDKIESDEEIIADEEYQTIDGNDDVLDDSIEFYGVVKESEVEQYETSAEENAENQSPLVDEEPMVDGSEEGSLDSDTEDFSEINTQSEEIETENDIALPDIPEVVTEEIEDLDIEEIRTEEPLIVLDTPMEEKVEDDAEEPLEVSLDEEPIEVEEESLPYDPFMEEDVETLRKGLGDLLSRINFSLILAEEEPTVEKELSIEESINEEEIESANSDIPVLSNESGNVDIEEPQIESVDEEPQIDENSVESIIEEETQNDSSEELTQEVIFDESEIEEVIEEEKREVSKTLVIEEKSTSIIPGSIVIVDGESVTLLSTPGKAVKSPIDGVVVEAKRVEGKKTISIETDDGDVWRFSGFERVNVKLNQNVIEGEVLGSVGTSSGSSIDIALL